MVNDAKGYGFIEQEGGEDFRSLLGDIDDGFKTLAEGQKSSSDRDRNKGSMPPTARTKHSVVILKDLTSF